jgi:hypothetical protein
MIEVNRRLLRDLDHEQAENNLSLDDTLLRTQNRRRNLWKKNIIQPLDPVILKYEIFFKYLIC